MNFKDPSKDSGCYINGVYTSKNGSNEYGLVCPKGVRLYDPNMTDAVFFQPDDTAEGETFEMITPEVAEDILPYYAVSNYGRVMNIKTGKVLKPNYRPNGYEYLCLSADNCKNGQRKYNIHRLVLKTFEPVENMDNLVVNHINEVKTDNYVNKVMPDGTVKSNLEWVTPQENTQKSVDSGSLVKNKLNMDQAKEIRDLHDEGYSYAQIHDYKGFDFISCRTIQDVCLNKTHKDENYTPKTYEDSNKLNPANLHKLTDSDADIIRDLNEHGYSYKEIKDKFYPNFSESTMSNICRGKTHDK